MTMSKKEKSVVGDPLNWPGLVYSPLDIFGLLFALGVVAEMTGLIFEEFRSSECIGICRKKTESGWEKIVAALAFRSSEVKQKPDEIDLIICWIDDLPSESEIIRLELSRFSPAAPKDAQTISSSENLPIPENIREDFLSGNEIRESFEDTIRKLDDRIKKLNSR